MDPITLIIPSIYNWIKHEEMLWTDQDRVQLKVEPNGTYTITGQPHDLDEWVKELICADLDTRKQAWQAGDMDGGEPWTNERSVFSILRRTIWRDSGHIELMPKRV